MLIRLSVPQTTGHRLGGFVRFLRRRPQLAAAGVGVVTAALTAVASYRRRPDGPPSLPDPGTLAALTGRSVHNAAKGAIIATVRQESEPDDLVIDRLVRESMHEAAAAGADLVSAAIGVVEGAIEIAHLVDGARGAVPTVAARAAVHIADEHGEAAGSRVREVLADYLAHP